MGRREREEGREEEGRGWEEGEGEGGGRGKKEIVQCGCYEFQNVWERSGVDTGVALELIKEHQQV